MSGCIRVPAVHLPVTEVAASYVDLIGDADRHLDELVDSESLWLLLDQLPPRELQMVLLRFYGNKTQSDIADQLGISQMHVSRLLHQTLETLRTQLTG